MTWYGNSCELTSSFPGNRCSRVRVEFLFSEHLLPSGGKRCNSSQCRPGHPWQRDSPDPGDSLQPSPRHRGAQTASRAGSSRNEGGSCLTLTWTGKNLGESQTEITDKKTCCNELSHRGLESGQSFSTSLLPSHPLVFLHMWSPLMPLSLLFRPKVEGGVSLPQGQCSSSQEAL